MELVLAAVSAFLIICTLANVGRKHAEMLEVLSLQISIVLPQKQESQTNALKFSRII